MQYLLDIKLLLIFGEILTSSRAYSYRPALIKHTECKTNMGSILPSPFRNFSWNILAIWMTWHTDLIVPREFASSVVLPESTRWWITGGVGSNGIDLGETEVYENGIFRLGPDLPKALREHCMARKQ